MTLLAPAAVAGVGTDQTGVAGNASAAVLIAMAAALLLMLVFRSPVEKLHRIIGTSLDKRRVRRQLQRHSKQVLHDFLLPGAYGGLTRIDHALMSRGGFFCIQTKFCNGTIAGGADDPQWLNADGIQDRKFLNPLIQNQGRSKALQNALPGMPVASVVVFCGDVELLEIPAANVLHLRDLGRYLADFEFDTSPAEDRNATWAALVAAALTDKDSRKDFDAQLSFS